MRDAIVRALSWALSVLAPRPPGRHSAAYFAARAREAGAAPEPVNPWSRPWTTPTKEEAAEFFRRQAGQRPAPRPVTRERRRAVLLATMGVDYPYTYEGAPFPRAAFEGAGVVA
ncbi:hypothetical protein JJV70_15015 [Streptomyces sp. JJ66]|uniref:hypothetical protein n=1 Tax=Streptomyces sp. JJ66 TaxID=2803843 RepID=UPI001C58FF5A|nr:hypothetical protein [Streptomyces sp. JJ66]MBW1603389.1 hypothetical protein [Streptomyces sp. JJ66]